MQSGKYEYQSEFARKYFGAGKAEGKAEGMAEGEAKGKAELLSKQMQLKFGELPAEIRERIRNPSVDDLDRWAERILGAAALEEVFR